MFALEAWKRDERGGVALVFGLVSVVLVTAVGAAFDYSRAASTGTDLQSAVDGAALLLAKTGDSTGAYTVADETAASYVRKTFGANRIDDLAVKVRFVDGRVIVDATGSLRTTLTNVVGIKEMPIARSAEVSVSDRLEVALVLDNTGSMAASGKLDALKVAAHNFLTKMRGAIRPDFVKVALVPFDTDVNVGTANLSAPWLDPDSLSAWTAAPATAGCITDRAPGYDVDDTPPSPSLRATLFKANANRGSPCTLAPMLPLTVIEPTAQGSKLDAAIDAMRASGNTNTTIGLVWGYHMLTSSEPMSGAVPLGTRGVQKFLIFMTDGQNTQNGTTKVQSEIDERTRLVCENLRRTPIKVFTVRVIQGNEPLIRQCATDPNATDPDKRMYFDVQDPAQLDPTFQRIADQITRLRISR